MENKPKTKTNFAELRLAPAGSRLSTAKVQGTYDGGFHVSAAANRKKGQRIVGKRSGLQNFTC